jgi:hypothetical protein
MDKGVIAEFAPPTELFKMTNGIFRGMCEQSSISLEDIERSRFETFQQEIEALEQQPKQEHEEQSPTDGETAPESKGAAP